MADGKIWQDVTFYSDGLKIAANLYRPADWHPGDPPRPAVLSLAGYTGMKDIYGLDVPRRLWEEGYFVLAPDHRGFGASEGRRGRQRPLEQCQDAYDALTFLETVEGVDHERLGIYGTSFGGANATWVAALDDRVRVVVTSVMVADGYRWMGVMRSAADFAAFRHRVRDAAKRRVLTNEDERIPLLQIMPPDPHTRGVIQAHHQRDDRYVGEFDMASAEACLRYRPEWLAPHISPRPVLVIYAEDDELCSGEAQRCYEVLGEPKKLVKLPHAQHYESYHFCNPELHEIGMGETVAWYREHL